MNIRFWAFVLWIGFMLSMISGSAGAAWTFNTYYQNAVNITVNNWNYTQSYLTGNTNLVLKGSAVNYVMVEIPTAAALSSYTIEGYDAGLNNLGTINYFPLLSQGGNSWILIPRYTNLGIGWKTATIYYNTPNVTIGTVNTSGKFINAFKQYQQQNIIGYDIGGNYFNITSSPYWSNSPIFSVNGTIPKYGMVILTSNSLLNGAFNVTARPTSFLVSRVNGTSGIPQKIYSTSVLNPLAFSYPFVTNVSETSYNANFLFGPITGKNGFEEYISRNINSSVVIAEGTHVDMCSGTCLINPNFIVNASTKTGFTGVPQVFGAYKFNISIPMNAQTTFYILPAFTSNYIMQANAINPSNAVVTNKTVTWNYAIHITNIIWNYSFPSLGTYYNYTSNNVKYALIQVPHYVGMGVACQSMAAKDNTSTTFSGYVHFAVVNCTTSSVWIIVNQTSTFGDFISDFYLLFNNTFGLTSGYGFANSSTLSNWRFRNKLSSFTINQVNMPNDTERFLLNLSASVGASDKLSLINWTGTLGGSAQVMESGGTTQLDLFSGSNAGKVINPDALWLYNYTYTTLGSSTTDIASESSLFSGYPGQQPAVCNAMGCSVPGGGFNNINLLANVVLTTGKTATAEYIYTRTATVNPAYAISNVTMPNTTSPYPNPVSVPPTGTTNGIFTTNSPCFTCNSLTGNVPIFPGLNYPKGLIAVFGIILFLIVSLTLSERTNAEMGISFMLIFVWIIGIFQVQVLILAVVLSIIFVAVEFVQKSRKGSIFKGDTQ